MTELTNERAAFEAWFSGWHDPCVGMVETQIQKVAAVAAWKAARTITAEQVEQIRREAVEAISHELWCAGVNLDGANEHLAEVQAELAGLREAVEADRRARSDIGLAATELLQYLDAHDWGGIPEGATADRLRAALAGNPHKLGEQSSYDAQGVKPWRERLYLGYEECDKHEAMEAEIADLRAQLAAATENLQTAVQQAWIANAELSKLRAQIARQSQDGERYRLVRAQLSRCDFNYFLLEGQLESDLDEYCDDELARGRAALPLSSEPQADA